MSSLIVTVTASVGRLIDREVMLPWAGWADDRDLAGASSLCWVVERPDDCLTDGVLAAIAACACACACLFCGGCCESDDCERLVDSNKATRALLFSRVLAGWLAGCVAVPSQRCCLSGSRKTNATAQRRQLLVFFVRVAAAGAKKQGF